MQKAPDNKMRTKLEYSANTVICSHHPAARTLIAPISCAAHGAHHDGSANAYWAARINYEGMAMSRLATTVATATPLGAKGQTCENRGDLDTERNDAPIVPAVRAADRKMQSSPASPQ